MTPDQASSRPETDPNPSDSDPAGTRSTRDWQTPTLRHLVASAATQGVRATPDSEGTS
ncbi:MAG: hypothetical protein JO276_09190 [Sphingomonadaceae bacterium]|nr:hypothetical protein [Sphingomonadaceae bacterium]